MLQLLDSLGVERVAVVSHDVGAAAAQIMVSLAPARLQALVVMDGGYADEWAMESLESIRAWDPGNAARLLPVLSRRLDRAGLLREALAAYAGDEGGRKLIRAARDFDPRQTAPIVELLRRSDIPSLVVWGESDNFFPIETVARPLAELLSARLVTLPGGHFLPAERPAEVAAILREFLSSLRSPEAGARKMADS
jgi:pimeloyl-ACP methyl ester carboxylesterase